MVRGHILHRVLTAMAMLLNLVTSPEQVELGMVLGEAQLMAKVVPPRLGRMDRRMGSRTSSLVATVVGTQVILYQHRTLG